MSQLQPITFRERVSPWCNLIEQNRLADELVVCNLKKFDGGHLGFSRWPKINSVYPLDNMKTIFKSKVNWGNGFKDIAFTSITFNSTYILKVQWRPS